MAIAMQSVTEARETFVSEERNRAAQARGAAADLARVMVGHMAEGSEYGIEDFIFAASSGHPQDAQDHLETLKTIEGLTPGTVVGLTHRSRLLVVGVSDEHPLDLSVRYSPHESSDIQRNRELKANIRLFIGATATKEEYVQPTKVNVTVKNEPFLAQVLWHMGENHYYEPQRIFYDPKGIIVGTEALINHVLMTDDKVGGRQIAAVVESLAQTAIQGVNS